LVDDKLVILLGNYSERFGVVFRNVFFVTAG
jgi:hypothetical protein